MIIWFNNASSSSGLKHTDCWHRESSSHNDEDVFELPAHKNRSQEKFSKKATINHDLDFRGTDPRVLPGVFELFRAVRQEFVSFLDRLLLVDGLKDKKSLTHNLKLFLFLFRFLPPKHFLLWFPTRWKEYMIIIFKHSAMRNQSFTLQQQVHRLSHLTIHS